MKYVILLFLFFVSCSTEQQPYRTTFNKYLNNLVKKTPLVPKSTDTGLAKYYEGTVVAIGNETIDGQVVILPEKNPDTMTGATKLFRSLEPKPNDLQSPTPRLAKDTIEIFFTSGLTNNSSGDFPLPEYTVKLLVSENGEVLFAEWEYLRIEFQTSRYYGTYRITAKDGKWDPNTSYVGRPGNIKDAEGTVTWDSQDKVVTFITKFTDAKGNKRIIQSPYKFREIYREYDTILQEGFEQYEDYHFVYKKSSDK